MRSRTPEGLGVAGRRLWREVVAGYELRPDELVLLERAARTLDDVRRLEDALDGAPLTVPGSMGQTRANPLLVELRGMRALLAALLKQLALPDLGAGAQSDEMTPTRKARKAARARWDAQYGA